jgi:uncharacterized delta-60 repeat protein
MFACGHNGFGAGAPYSIECLERRVLLTHYALDPTFGQDGIGLAELGALQGFNNPLAVAELGGSKIVAVAAVGSGDPGALTSAAIARFNPDGTIDTSFGTGGVVVVPIAEALADALVLFDGRIVLAGHDGGDLILAQLTADGQLDTSFAGDGIAEITIASSANQTIAAMSVSQDGDVNLVVSGELRTGSGGGQLVLARFTPDGILDTSFSGDGVLIDPNLPGSLATAGFGARHVFTAGVDPLTSEGRVAVARFTPEGTPDPAFGQGGVVTLPAVNAGADVVSAITADIANVLIGGAGFLALLDEDGSAVTRFSGDGIATVPAALGSSNVVHQIDSDDVNPITAVTGSGLFRVSGTGTLDPDFGSNGVVLIDGMFSAAINWPSRDRRAVLVGGRATDGSAIAVARVSLQPDVFLTPAGVLTVRAENLENNTITLSAVGNEARLQVNGQLSTYPLADVNGFDVDAGFGNSVTLTIDIPATVRAAGGDDTITTADGDDVIVDQGGNNLITTGAGRDSIEAHGGGNNTITTGAGDDRVVTGEGDDSVITGDGDDVIDVWLGNNTVVSNGGDDGIAASEGNDSLDAGAGNDRVDARGGRNTISAGDGDDFVNALDGNDSITGGAGDDHIRAGNGDNLVFAGDGDDYVRSGAGRDTLWGEIGYDEIRAGDGDDYINAGAGKDRLFGQQGNDVIYAGRNNDALDGGPGRDLLKGGDGDDKLWDRDGFADSVFGGLGDDLGSFDDAEDILTEVEQLLA